MSEDFSGQVALVTGAGRGIGEAIAKAFANAGAAVIVNDINGSAARRVAEEIVAGGGQALARPFDVANETAVGAMVQMAVEELGQIDILVNNAGVEPKFPLLETSLYAWERTLAVNLTGTFLCTRAVGRVMHEQGRGAIVNIASIAGHRIPLRDRAAYCASKAGVVGFTRECAREFAALGIRVNAVCPGVIETPMTTESRADPAVMRKWLEDIPAGRLGQPEDVVGVVLFLCSPNAGYVTGQAIHVDGGKVMA